MMKRKLIPFTLFLAALSASTTSIAASQEISKSIYTCNDNQVMEVILRQHRGWKRLCDYQSGKRDDPDAVNENGLRSKLRSHRQKLYL
ncbi:Periplasmic lysozyme inhibitor of c-typelysozyme [Salmonella enterica subsp. enterica]|uniref:Periplasmic lysozyme inhibitor of c-typelysozyme n=1 Tax=Salmonella enterica I TaxID=59201 RepID=A0A447U4N3_SALET|nr:Periplasmic lysozyme inhibitor of c-typelysozyme [Salmonella enterica subsp. enterica]